MMKPSLLVELFTEELPPKSLEKLADSFALTAQSALVKAGFVAEGSPLAIYATPRRMAWVLSEVLAIAPDQSVTRKGPAVASAMKAGEPTPALLGFARSCGVTVAELSVGHDGKQDVYVFESVQKGATLADVLADVVADALKKMPIPKTMRWGNSDVQFVRPVHGLVMLHGTELIEGSVLGLDSGRVTHGHRFLANQTLSIASADDYATCLSQNGFVMADFQARKAKIKADLDAAANLLHASIAAEEDLLNEVTALVEWPCVMQAEFEAEFLSVPQECLILTMQQNQKYFPLLDKNGKLMNQFLLVSNIQPSDQQFVIGGNERVLRARLSDAQFFFEQDKKQRLESRLPRFETVVYHNKIGSQLARIERLADIAANLAPLLGVDVSATRRAATLAKADLLSDMVGEFPELQGIMGAYYAAHDGESAATAAAIKGHYYPRFGGDVLPEGGMATAVSLADKLEVLIGIWGIGLIPTGDKDPYALRRAALGVVRMCLVNPLNLLDLLNKTAATFPAGVVADGTAQAVLAFCLERLKNFLATDYPADVIEAVLALNPVMFNQIPARLAAVTAFKALPESHALAAANKRVGNLLKKNSASRVAVSAEWFEMDAEKALAAAIAAVQPKVAAQIEQGDYQGALSSLVVLKTPVDAFFDGVMVMADNVDVRNNRLALLGELSVLLNSVADISVLTA